MRPEKKVAFIPEANRGLELQTACELGRLCIVSPDPEARKTAPSCDVTKPEDRRAVRDHFERRCGKLDIPLNNAAIFMEREKVLVRPRALSCSNIVSSANLDETFEGNFFAQPSDNLLIEVRY
jgi:NAD(P)-dependent dehydrogenase (short-subunit alcohol dehydrogenase family)